MHILMSVAPNSHSFIMHGALLGYVIACDK